MKNNTSQTAAPRLATRRRGPPGPGRRRRGRPGWPTGLAPGRGQDRGRGAPAPSADPVQGGDHGEGGDHGRGRPQPEGPQVPRLGHPPTMGLGGQSPEPEPGHGQQRPPKPRRPSEVPHQLLGRHARGRPRRLVGRRAVRSAARSAWSVTRSPWSGAAPNCEARPAYVPAKPMLAKPVSPAATCSTRSV